MNTNPAVKIQLGPLQIMALKISLRRSLRNLRHTFEQLKVFDGTFVLTQRSRVFFQDIRSRSDTETLTKLLVLKRHSAMFFHLLQVILIQKVVT